MQAEAGIAAESGFCFKTRLSFFLRMECRMMPSDAGLTAEIPRRVAYRDGAAKCEREGPYEAAHFRANCADPSMRPAPNFLESPNRITANGLTVRPLRKV